jgi:DNA-binding transcriptional LysR family regulator
MTATPYALGVRADVHRLVQEAQGLLAPRRDLDLSTLERTFTLQFHDAVTAAIGPDLLAGIRAQAPGVRLRFLAEASTDTSDLRHGKADLEAGATEPALPEIHGDTVAHDHLAVAIRAAYPRKRLTAGQYAAEQHVIVSRRGRLRDPIDDALDARGLRRQTVASAPTTAAALDFARVNDVLVTVPERMSARAVERCGLRLMALPLEVPPVPLILAWHQRYDGDRAHTWLREQVRAALRIVIASG